MHSSFLRPATSLAAVAVAIFLPAAAQAQTRSFDIPAQSASSGIRQFAQQAGIQITLAGRDGDGRATNVVQGSLDVRTALEQLLLGTGLTVRSFDGKVAILGADAAQTAAGGESAIVVTGSRIVRPELESAMPVSVVNMDEARSLGRLTVFDALKRVPSIFTGVGLTNSLNQQYDGGIAAVSLRNLGENRTLTLLDGMRRVSGSARSSMVDLNMIPPEMVDRIEVVTGGAAAVYGADAVTGAVNIITKKHVDGLNLSGTTGISKYGDGRQTSLSASFGTSFAGGRGSFSIGGTYNNISILFSGDRPFSRNRILYSPNPANTGPNDGIPDRVINYNEKEFFFAYNPVWYMNGSSYMYDNRTGTVRVPTYDKTFVSGEFSQGEGGTDGRNLLDHAFLRGPVESAAVLGRFDYELSDTVNFSTRFDYGHTHYNGPYYPLRNDSRPIVMGGNGGEVIRLDNPYLPDSVRTFMLVNGLNNIKMGRTYGNLPIIKDIHNRETFTINPSLDGKLADRFTWNLFYQYGRSRDNVLGTNQPRLSHWLAARDPIADPNTGQPVCRDETARAAGCVPFNFFTTDAFTPEQISWLLTSRKERRINTQQIAGGNIQGQLFQLPYGMVSGVLGAEYRRETLVTTDDPLALSGETAFVSAAKSVHPELDVTSKVYEFYGELVVPLLSDLPFARRLEVEGAYRYSHYNSFGGTDTWKVGGTWVPLDGVTFRAVRSRSIRTPNFGELYEPQNVAATGVPADPCGVGAYFLSPTRAANCAALGVATPLPNYGVGPLTTSGGNPNLSPEVSNSLTLGVVLQPAFLPRFDVTIDYWNIDIDDVITQFSPTTVFNLCVDLPSIDNVFCQRQQRNSEGYLTNLINTQVNASRMLARGVDFGANWRVPLGSGQLGFNFKGTWLLKNVVYTTPGIVAGNVVKDGGYQNPQFRASFLTSYSNKDLSIAFDTRFIGASKYDSTVTSNEFYEDNTIKSFVYNDLSITKTIQDKFDISFGINNIFDVKPPLFPSVQYDEGGYYDIVGRYFFTSFRVKI